MRPLCHIRLYVNTKSSITLRGCEVKKKGVQYGGKCRERRFSFPMHPLLFGRIFVLCNVGLNREHSIQVS